MDINDLYKINSLDEIKGQETAITALRSFVHHTNKNNKHKPLMVFGPTGTGKTVAVRALARESNWRAMEMNASDYRDSESIKSIISSAMSPRNLLGTRTLIIMDEIDNLDTKFDRGAQSAISELIDKSASPIIFIADDMWDQSISFLRSKTTPVGFKKVTPEDILIVLKGLNKKFELGVDATIMESISKNSNGDVRSAINDMFVVHGPGATTDILGIRDRKLEIFKVLDRIFLSNTINAPLAAIMNADLDKDMLINWIDENIAKRYTEMQDACRAFESLSSATIYSSRAVRSQYYTYWRYMNAYLAAGVALAKRHAPDMSARYSFPKRIKDLSASKGERTTASSIAKKLQKRINSNLSVIKRDYIPLVAKMAHKAHAQLKSNEKIYEYLERTYELTDSEANWLIDKAY